MASASTEDLAAEGAEWTKPPFLRRVRIRGYKSIAFCDVTLGPLTILVGRNASGKSNFLDALVFLRDIVKLGVDEAVKRHGGAEAIVCRTQEDRLVSVGIECDYLISGDADGWHATHQIDIELPKTRPAAIHYEKMRIEQGAWWLGYTNEAGRVT
jgi:predicted ATPase